jgi:hypothetical protein
MRASPPDILYRLFPEEQVISFTRRIVEYKRLLNMKLNYTQINVSNGQFYQANPPQV